MSGWSMAASWPAVVAGLAVVIAVGWICVLNVQRMAGRRLFAALEVVRWVTVCLIVFTLWRPEVVRQRKPSKQPVIAVLVDGSRSMETKDVVTEPSTVMARNAWVDKQLQNSSWGAVSNRFQIVVERFSEKAEGTDINTALEDALGKNRDLRAVMLLSDGDWNLGKSPVAGSTKLRMANVPVFAVSVGSGEYLPDVVLENVAAPAYGLLGEQIFIPFKVRSHLAREVKTRVSLMVDGAAATSKDVTIPARGVVEDALFWTPVREGEITPSMRVPVEQDELRPDNNEQSFHIAIRKEVLRVLIVDSLPRWEYRYLRNAMERDPGVELRTVLFHPGMGMGGGRDYLPAFPKSKDELSKFDVIFVGDVGIGSGELSAEDADALKGLVEQQGSGLVFLPGSRGRQSTFAGTALEEMMPVEVDEKEARGVSANSPSHLALTQLGRGHLLTMLASSEAENERLWRMLPGFYWHAAVRKAKGGADVLGVHEGMRNQWGRIPLLVTRQQGNGKVLFMGVDSAWRWRRGVEDVYHYRFWGQVVRWMSYQRHVAHEQGIRVFYNPDAPQRGDVVRLHATVFDVSGLPIGTGKVSADVVSPAGKTERLELTPVEGGWGVFEGRFVAGQQGAYKLKVRSETTGKEVETQLDVGGQQREEVGRPAQIDVLREISQITRGKLVSPDEMTGLVTELAALPEPEPVEQRFRLWCHPAWAGVLTALLAVYWVGRKMVGMI